jgi:hypothetical protein
MSLFLSSPLFYLHTLKGRRRHLIAMNEGFDLLIAGEGSAGCVSAKRADRRLGSTVLLINKSGQ